MFPLRERAKEPLTRNGVLDGTTDEAQIRTWWEKYPRANIGIATGKSGLAVFDVDGPEGEAAWTSHQLAQGAAPETVIAYTGSGGRHFIFAANGADLGRWPDGGQHVLGPASHVDLRAGNSYIVAPPSVHPVTGKRYEWDAEAHPAEIKPASLPVALQDALRGAGDKKAVSSLPATIYDGEGREDALVRQGGYLRRGGLTEEEIYAALSAFNEARIRPPKPDKDIRRIARSVARYEPEPDEAEMIEDVLPGALAALQSSAEARQVAAAPAADGLNLAGVKAPEPTDFDALIEDGVTWAARADATVPKLIPGVLHAGALAVMASTPKSGKTWLAYDMMLSLVSGKPFMGVMPVEKTGRVLYIATEGIHADSRDRLYALALGKDVPLNDTLRGIDFIWRRGVFLDDLAFLAWLGKRAEKYALIAVDVISKGWRGSENDNAEVIKLLRGLDPVINAGPSVLLLHHNVKPSELTEARRAGLNIRGAGAWYGELDDGIYLVRKKGQKRTRVEMETRAGAPAEAFSFAWPESEVDGLAPVTLDYQSEPEDTTMSDETADIKAAVLAAVAAEPGLAIAALAKRVHKRRTTVEAIVNLAVEEGGIRVRSEPVKTGDRVGFDKSYFPA